MDVVNEGDVVGRMPVKTVAMDVKRNRVNHVVDWSDNLNTENFTYPEC